MEIQGQEMDPRVWAVLTHAEKWMLGGSRGAGVGTPESDWDYIVLLPLVGSHKHGALYNALHANGFVEQPPQAYDAAELPIVEPSHFRWTLPQVDLLLFTQEADYEKWETATKVCQKLHLTSREDRILVHRAVKWGKYVEPGKDTPKEESNAIPF